MFIQLAISGGNTLKLPLKKYNNKKQYIYEYNNNILSIEKLATPHQLYDIDFRNIPKDIYVDWGYTPGRIFKDMRRDHKIKLSFLSNGNDKWNVVLWRIIKNKKVIIDKIFLDEWPHSINFIE